MRSKKQYFNTTNLVAEELQEATDKAIFLREAILKVHQDHPEQEFTPFQMQVKLLQRGYKYPITSVRARMTTLRKQSKLIMSANADALGNYNAKNHTWRLAISEQTIKPII